MPNRKQLVRYLMLATLATFDWQSAWAGDVAAARTKVQTMCQVCHGADGVAVVPGAANLSGQQKEYLVTQLRAFRSGSRVEAQMSVVAKTLSDADIENLAEWYAAIKVNVEMPKE
jgi:cytochrome c553